ncbi:MAG TPA: hypothetical protein VMQ93_05375 [Novosphingobium sp.]|nr:hypothetical protein [Novosphingobium sp.]
MRALLPVLAAVGLVVGAVPAVAAPAKKAAAPKAAAPAAPAAADVAQSEHAVLYLKVLISALQSDQIKDEAKSALVGCLYENPLGKISESMDKVFAENADKVHRDKPSEVLAVLTAVCGYKGDPTQPAPAAAPTGR